MNTALEAIRGGMPVQKAATEYGIPSGTLYGRCKKVGIELSKNTQVFTYMTILTISVTSCYNSRFTGPRTI